MSTSMTVSERGAPRQARSEAMAVIGLAAAAVVAIVVLYSRPAALAAALLGLTGMGLWRWHTARDLSHFVAGAVFGNLTELASDAAGIWVHANRDLFGIAPVYIFLCYPLLGLAFPRLLEAAAILREAPERRTTASLLRAVAVLGGFVALSCRFGTQNTAQTWVCLLSLPLCLALFHDRCDLTAAFMGGGLGLLWELPCTALRIWTFPDPQVFGLIPAWLPLAYALFFVVLVRIGDALPIGRTHPDTTPLLRTSCHET